MEIRTVLSIFLFSLGSAAFGLGVYCFHTTFYHILTISLTGIGCLIIVVATAYLCGEESKIKEFFKIGVRKSKEIKRRVPRKPKKR